MLIVLVMIQRESTCLNRFHVLGVEGRWRCGLTSKQLPALHVGDVANERSLSSPVGRQRTNAKRRSRCQIRYGGNALSVATGFRRKFPKVYLVCVHPAILSVALPMQPVTLQTVAALIQAISIHESRRAPSFQRHAHPIRLRSFIPLLTATGQVVRKEW